MANCDSLNIFSIFKGDLGLTGPQGLIGEPGIGIAGPKVK